MMRTGRRAGPVACVVVALLMLLGPAAQAAFAAAYVRFIDAQPGASAANLEVSSSGLTESAGGPASFGQLTPYANAAPGEASLRLATGSQHATKSTRLVDGGHYTVAATGSGANTRLLVYSDGPAKPGAARLRLLHLAPELGAPNVELSGRPIAQALRFGQSTGYLDLTPGAYTLTLSAPHRSQPISSARITLVAGTASSAIVTGSAGAPVHAQLAQDVTATPGGPPPTGLGGLARGAGPAWLAVALIALAGGGLGGALARRSKRT